VLARPAATVAATEWDGGAAGRDPAGSPDGVDAWTHHSGVVLTSPVPYGNDADPAVVGLGGRPQPSALGAKEIRHKSAYPPFDQ
jgi:hypothetical protein